MRNTLVIAGKELQGYFVQPVAYVVLTVFLLLGGWFFFAMLRQFDEMVQLIQMMGQQQQLQNMNLNTRVIDPLLHDLSIVLVIVMPALTMRIFAEEKRTGTYELLLTAPVRTGEIVAGKRAITADTDLRLCRLFGLSNGYWLRAQAAYDTEVAAKELADTLRRIKPWVGTAA